MRKLTVPMTEKETNWGWIYFICQMTFLQMILIAIGYYLGIELSETTGNFLYFSINFICTILIFHKYLLASLKIALENPLRCVTFVAMGFALYYLLSLLNGTLIYKLYPNFNNVNDNSIIEMADQSPLLMMVGVVCLVPLAEEMTFRGLIFRPLYNRSHLLAYLVSTVGFSLLHIMGYIGQYEPVLLFLCFIQYIPAGFCLGWVYARTNTIITPILLHTTVNLISMLTSR